MANVFNSNVHKQQYDEGVMQELRDSIPFSSVTKIRNDNVEYIYDRYGDDSSAENTSDGNYSVTDATYSADSKLIDKEAVKSHRIRYKEMAREGFDIAVDMSDRHGFAMAEAVHRHATDTVYSLANGVVDNEVLGGSPSALTPIALSTSNPDDVSATVTQVLQENNAFGEGTPFIMMSPKQAKNFNLYAMGAGFDTADNALRDGLFRVNRGYLFGMDTIVTNEVPRTVDLTFGGQPTNAETFTITVGGTTVTFTMLATPSGAGAIDIGADAEGTIDNIVEAINAATGQGSAANAGTNFIALSASDQEVLKNAGVRASKESATVLRITTFKYATIAESLTNVTLGTYTENVLAGVRNAAEIVLPSKGFHSEDKQVTGFNGIELTTTQVHDAHVFQKNRDKVVRVLLEA